MSIVVNFLTPLRVESVGKWDWRLLESFCVEVDGLVYTVPTEYKTDFASVPRIPLLYLIAGGRGSKAATLHDWMYFDRAQRKWADRVFHAALLQEGHNPVVSWLMYVGVRISGRHSYKRNARR